MNLNQILPLEDQNKTDLSYVMNDVAILNSGFKLLGFTPLHEKKDRLKALSFKSRKSIKRLEKKGSPSESETSIGTYAFNKLQRGLLFFII